METRTIKTKAELKRLRVGTRLILIDCLMGPCHQPRTIKEVRSNSIKMQLEDGRISTLDLHGKLEPTAEGFLIRCEDGRIRVQYIVHA